MFQLRTVARSHGWFDLPPFEWDSARQSLTIVAWVGKLPATIRVTQPTIGRIDLVAERPGRLGTAANREVIEIARRCLGLDLDLGDFYASAGEPYRWAAELGAGPFLRSASVFEDAVKMLATTNCSWSLARLMVSRLVESLGEQAPDGRRSFPTPEAMASQSTDFYRVQVRAGYRAEALLRFARQVAGGEIDPEGWASFPGSTAELVRTIEQVHGLGRYSAENLCRLLGRFDGLGLDSWCLKKYRQIRRVRGPDVAAAIRRRYRRYGQWQGLALWLDLTRDWHQAEEIADQTTSFEPPRESQNRAR